MFKPKEMSRTVIIGSKADLEKTVKTLHELRIAHIIDFIPNGTDKTFRMGKPAAEASGASEKLLKVRSSAKHLELEDNEITNKEKVQTETVIKGLETKLGELESNINTLADEKSKIDDELKTLEDRMAQLRPFIGIDLPVEYYRGYLNVVVYSGRISDIQKLNEYLSMTSISHEMYASKSDKEMFVLFIEKEDSFKIAEIMELVGYTEVKVPDGSGLPNDIITGIETKILDLLEKKKKIYEQLGDMKKKYADFILASEEYLSIEVQKAEAPVRFATTDHSFVIDCWVPKKDLGKVREVLKNEFNDGLYVEEIDVKDEDEPPVQLENPKPVKPFELLLDLYSTPTYREIDPSFVLSLIFPLFFGFMIGDFGYGILLIITGYVFMKKFKNSEWLYNIGWYIIVAGVFAAIFGLLLFGDMFGLSFMPSTGSRSGITYSWSSLLGFTVPIPSHIEKIESSGVIQLLLISIVAGFLHIALGLLFGIINDRKHDKRHAISKIGLFFVLVGLSLVIFNMGHHTVARWLLPVKNSAIGTSLWTYVMIPLNQGMLFNGIRIPYSVFVFVLTGMVILLATIGAFGLLEMLEITSHLVSYTRLAAICVAKGAMAFSFNVIGLALILSGNIILGVLGIVIIVILQLIVFILGSLSSGIQALRLHFVEHFMKYYKGGGSKFNPFGYLRKYTKTQSV